MYYKYILYSFVNYFYPLNNILWTIYVNNIWGIFLSTTSSPSHTISYAWRCASRNTHECAFARLFYEEILLEVELLDQKIFQHSRIFNSHWKISFQKVYGNLHSSKLHRMTEYSHVQRVRTFPTLNNCSNKQ